MKKLKFKSIEVNNMEVLSRDQLKNVLGGLGSGSDGTNFNCYCADGLGFGVTVDDMKDLADKVGKICGGQNADCARAEG